MGRVPAALSVAILVVLTAACDRSPPGSAPPRAPTSVTSPAAPDTSASPTARPAELPRIDLAGIRKLVADSSGRGNILVVDFWATWCAPCLEMFPELHGDLARLGPGVELVSVTLDDPGEREAMALGFLREHGGTEHAYMLVPDEDERIRVVDELGEDWNNLVVPAILVYGPDGRLAGEFVRIEEAGPVLAKVRAMLRTPPVTPNHEDAGSKHEQAL